MAGAVRDTVASALPRAAIGNPLLLGNDAPPGDFGLALQALASRRETGTAFVVHAPTHSAPAVDCGCCTNTDCRKTSRISRLASLFFGCVDQATRDELHADGIPVHTTPQRLARAFTRLVDYRQGRELLMQTQGSVPAKLPEGLDEMQSEIQNALGNGITKLSKRRASYPLTSTIRHSGKARATETNVRRCCGDQVTPLESSNFRARF